MAAFRIDQSVELNNPRDQSVPNLYAHVNDDQAHVWAVTLTRSGAAEDLTGYTAMALHRRSDGGTVEINATIADNVVTVTFPAESYAYQGDGQVVLMRLTKAETGEETIVAGTRLNVAESETGTIIAPGTDITTTLSGLLASEAARVAAEEDRVDAEAARAASMTYDASVMLIDSSAASTSGISTTSRRFIKDPIPAGAHIGTLQFRAHTTNVATVTVEVWEYDITTGNLVVAKSVAYSANGTTGVKTVTIDYDVVKLAYISLRNSASCVGYTAGEGYYVTDVSSTTLAFSALGYASTVKLSVTLAYTTTAQIRNVALSVKNNMITVGVNGDYQTIQAACTAALPGSTILVYPGVYREQVKAYGKELHIIGIDKRTCILIDSSADYRTPPLQINLGSVENMTIIEDALSPTTDTTFEGHPTRNMAYCIHADSGTGIYGVSDVYLDIVNCILVNANRPCIGAGTYAKQHIRIAQCDMRSGLGVVDGYHRGALYFHNCATNSVLGQTVDIIENRIYCDDDDAAYVLDTGATGGTFTMEFLRNAVYSAINGKADAAVYGTFSTSDAEFKLSPVSYGNSVSALNAV